MVSPYEQQRIDDLKREIIEDYNRTQTVDKIINKLDATESNQDFTKVYIRYLLERIWFSDSSHYPDFGPIGGAIARGEMNYLLSNIHKSVETETIEFRSLTPSLLKERISEIEPSIGSISVLASVEKMYLQFLKKREWNLSYDYSVKNYQINIEGIRINFLGYHGADFGSDILIMSKHVCNFLYRLYEDPIIGSTHLNFAVSLSQNNQKFDFLVHSTVRIDSFDREKVKIYRVEGGEE